MLVIPTLRQGGAERVMSELANEWACRGHEVHLILLAKHKEFYTIKQEVIIHRLGFENKNVFSKVTSEVRTFYRLRKLMKELRPSFILSFMEKYNILTILAGRFLDLNVYVSDRSNPFKKLPNHISILRRIVYKYATGIIAQTETAADMIREKIKNGNVKVIPNPIKQINNSLLIKKEKIILNVGRLVNEKGQEYLLDAFAMIEDNEWELVILGEGPLRRRLMEKADRLRISSRLTMPGAVNNVDEWLSKSTIFAFPSISEGYPNALLEAMSAGLSCVSFDCNVGPRDIIENDKNGYLVPVGDIAMFSEKLKNLMDSDEVRDRVGIQAKLSTENYSISVISSEYLRFCHS